MKITKIDDNTASIKTLLGRIDIKNNLEGPDNKMVVAININTPFGVKIEGLKEEVICPNCNQAIYIDKKIGKFILLKKEDKK